MAEATYRIVYYQDHQIDHVGEIPMAEAEAWATLATSWGLHVVTGWTTGKCSCGAGFWATKGDVHRSEHVERIEAKDDGLDGLDDGLLDIALAVGLLAPASHREGLRLVAS